MKKMVWEYQNTTSTSTTSGGTLRLFLNQNRTKMKSQNSCKAKNISTTAKFSSTILRKIIKILYSHCII